MTAPRLRWLPGEGRRASIPALVLAAALPLVFLHPMYQPSVSAGSVTVDLTDLAIAAAVLAAAGGAVGGGLAPLARTRAVWVGFCLFLAWLLLSLVWARANDGSYALGTHVVSALKYVEYALLAPVAALALRTAADRRALLVAFVAWSSFLTVVAALQFLGVVNEFDGRRPLQREPSYVGVHELGVISGSALSLGFVALLLGLHRRRGWAGGVAGGLGVALAAALDAVGGVAVAAAAAALAASRRRRLEPRRLLALAATVALVAVAAVTLRASSVSAFLQFLGVRPASKQTTTHVQSYAHRTLLAYIGFEIWLDHPVLGSGWQESQRPAAFRPHLAAAHRRFPNEPAAAFPSRAHEWGVQNGVLQTLADLGIVGLALLVGTILAALRVALRAASATSAEVAHGGLVALCWILVASAVFTGTGLLPGSSMEAMLWLAVGFAASTV